MAPRYLREGTMHRLNNMPNEPAERARPNERA